jgi:beta-barrel assembly-enhancing protease
LTTGGSKSKGLLWVVIAIVAASAAAIGLPYFAQHVPWRVERWMAAVLDGRPFNHVCQGRGRPEALALFRKLVKRIYPLDEQDRALPLAIDAIEGKTVNAFAGLGGHIYVFDGLIKQAQSAEELAGVLAHEIEHVRNRHIIQGVAVNLFTLGAIKIVLPGESAKSQIAYLLLTLKFSRQQENEADELGLRRLQAARVDAAGFGQFFARAEKMSAPPEFMSNHPSNEFRAQLAAHFRGYPVEPLMGEAEWAELKAICD